MQDLVLTAPPVWSIRAAVAMVWLYEGLWCKVLGREANQERVVSAVPVYGPRIGRAFLKVLGVVEMLVAGWVVSGILPGWCAAGQTALLVGLNANGLMWARKLIHDPAGMVFKNFSFLILAWVGGSR